MWDPLGPTGAGVWTFRWPVNVPEPLHAPEIKYRPTRIFAGGAVF